MTLTHLEFHVLLALAEGPLHGYAIMQDIAEHTAGQLTIGPGTLYSTIKRFLRDGLVEETAADSDRRRCYRLTRRGRAALSEEANRLNALVRVARQRGALGTS